MNEEQNNKDNFFLTYHDITHVLASEETPHFIEISVWSDAYTWWGRKGRQVGLELKRLLDGGGLGRRRGRAIVEVLFGTEARVILQGGTVTLVLLEWGTKGGRQDGLNTLH